MAKAYTFTVHDESVNTYGFRMLTDGANLEEFKKNPVILYNHNDWEAPIGRGENIRKSSGKILVDVVFDEDDENAKKIEGKVARNFLRMASVGSWAPEEVNDDPSLKLDGQTGTTVTKWTVREISICTIGSNHNALAMYDRNTQKRISLHDSSDFIRLMDKTDISINKNNSNKMSFITKLLKLSDSASEQAIQDEVQSLITLRDNLQTENTNLKATNKTLTEKLTVIENTQKEANKGKAIKLVDAAVKDGRIDAKAKDSWLEDFGTDFEKATIRLSSITPRTTIHTQIKGVSNITSAIELCDMTFSDIVSKDRLKELKKDPELYRKKFCEQYGHNPS